MTKIMLYDLLEWPNGFDAKPVIHEKILNGLKFRSQIATSSSTASQSRAQTKGAKMMLRHQQ